MKHAGREARRHCALASAWEFKEAKYYAKLRVAGLKHQRGREEYATLAQDDDIKCLLNYRHEVYHEDLSTFTVADLQLDQLEKEVEVRQSARRAMDDEVIRRDCNLGRASTCTE
jgi:hypothetical protein